jgi:hypothetical protein
MKCLFCDNKLRKTNKKPKRFYIGSSILDCLTYSCLFHDVNVDFMANKGSFYEVIIYDSEIRVINSYMYCSKFYYYWKDNRWNYLNYDLFFLLNKIEFSPSIIDKIKTILLFS